MRYRKVLLLGFLIGGFLWSSAALAQQPKNTQDLQAAIQNPIASLISVPFQNNTDFGFNPGNKSRNTLNIQPVLPYSISPKVNMIVRTIIPLVNQPLEPLGQSGGSEFGVGDISLSMFFTPAKSGKLIWGVGPALSIPTATDEVLGTEKWTAGPSIVGLRQSGPWTMGTLAQNTWSYAGKSSRGDVNFFYSQIFITRNLEKGWYVNTAPIITANWEASSGEQWLVPLGAGGGKLLTIGRQPVNIQAGYYNYIVSPDNGPDWQLRFQISLLFPK